MKRKSSGIVLGLALLLMLAACGSKSASIGSIPVYPDAEGIKSDQNNLAVQVIDAMEVSAEEQGLSTRFRLYSLPEGTTWEQIDAFYSTELATTDWVRDPALDNESQVFRVMGWVMGDDKGQSLVVVHVPDLMGGEAFLIVGLLRE